MIITLQFRQDITYEHTSSQSFHLHSLFIFFQCIYFKSENKTKQTKMKYTFLFSVMDELFKLAHNNF